MTRTSLLLAGALAFVLSLVWDAQAGAVYGWFAKPGTALSATGVSGTLGHGHVAALLLNGHVAIDNLDWRWRASRLLLGRLQVALDGGSSELRVHGQAYRSFSGVHLSEVSMEGSVANLVSIAGLAFAPLSGMVEAHLDDAAWNGSALRYATGTLEAHRVHWTLAQPPFLLGDFSAQVTTSASGEVQLHFNPGPGPLLVQGSVTLQPADQTFTADLWLQASTDGNPLLVNLLHSLGTPDAQGRYHLQNHGSLASTAALAGPPVPEPPAPGPGPHAGPTPLPEQGQLPSFNVGAPPPGAVPAIPVPAPRQPALGIAQPTPDAAVQYQSQVPGVPPMGDPPDYTAPAPDGAIPPGVARRPRMAQDPQ